MTHTIVKANPETIDLFEVMGDTIKFKGSHRQFLQTCKAMREEEWAHYLHPVVRYRAWVTTEPVTSIELQNLVSRLSHKVPV